MVGLLPRDQVSGFLKCPSRTECWGVVCVRGTETVTRGGDKRTRTQTVSGGEAWPGPLVPPLGHGGPERDPYRLSGRREAGLRQTACLPPPGCVLLPAPQTQRSPTGQLAGPPACPGGTPEPGPAGQRPQAGGCSAQNRRLPPSQKLMPTCAPLPVGNPDQGPRVACGGHHLLGTPQAQWQSLRGIVP